MPAWSQRSSRFLAALGLAALVINGPAAVAQENKISWVPKFSLNGRPGELTVQDLSGISTRPLRLLIKKNNRAQGREMIHTHALGVRVGDRLRMEWVLPGPGIRSTLYRIVKDKKGGPRYLTMPVSIYFDESRTGVYEETLAFFREQTLLLIFEKPDSLEGKSTNIRYFEERVRHLVVTEYKTNWFLSSLKLRMKDYGEDGSDFFERDAQLLVDRLIRPQQIIMVRLWKRTD